MKKTTQNSKELTSPENRFGQFLFYSLDDKQTRIEVRLFDETVWLTQKQMTNLFQKDIRTINEHIGNIFEEGELDQNSTIRHFRIVQSEGDRQVAREVIHYNLEVIISVGYRVKSQQGTQFRIWATERLREYIVKGFTLDDERLKQGGGGNYFDELLSRIRDIRSSEKLFWKKILDIYATSIDYDPRNDLSLEFFKVVQNKMHWAAHQHTAAEIISERADALKPNMGLTSWKGKKLQRSDVMIAKNYLTETELDMLNRITSFYLDFAELQAIQRKPMYMNDWIQKLDDFLKLSEQDILTHAGKISHEQAIKKACQEFDKYHTAALNEPSPIEKDFEEILAKLKNIEQTKK